MNSSVAVIDYGAGNIRSVAKALDFLGYPAEITAEPDRVSSADVLILPGVGSFRQAMANLQTSGLERAIRIAVNERGAKILGICLGMQLMAKIGTEGGLTAGLGLVNARVERFTDAELDGNKIPHVGFNHVTAPSGSKLFRGLPDNSDFYFVHSYRMQMLDQQVVVATCNHRAPFVAAFECDKAFGVQFHPEKSQTNGLTLLKNFLNL